MSIPHKGTRRINLYRVGDFDEAEEAAVSEFVFLSAYNSENHSLEAFSPPLIYNYCFYNIRKSVAKMKQCRTMTNLIMLKLFFFCK